MRLIDGDGLIDEICRDQCERKYKDCDSTCEIAAYVVNAPTIGGWISVKDKLPEEKENPYTQDYQEILCVLKTRFGTDVRVYKFGKGHFWNGPQEIDRMISHWMPLPEPPEENVTDGNH